MQTQNTFQNLQVLESARQGLIKKFGMKDYLEKVTHFVNVLVRVMNANSINEFEAAKKLQEETSFFDKPGAPLFFSAAVMEITEEKNFKGLRK